MPAACSAAASPIEDASYADWRAILDVNLTPLRRGPRCRVRARRRGASSTSALARAARPRTGIRPIPAKHAMVGLTYSSRRNSAPLASECGGARPVRGLARHAAMGQLRAGGPERVSTAWPPRRMGEAEDIAKAVMFFSSSLADFVTGQVLLSWRIVRRSASRGRGRRLLPSFSTLKDLRDDEPVSAAPTRRHSRRGHRCGARAADHRSRAGRVAEPSDQGDRALPPVVACHHAPARAKLGEVLGRT